MNFQDMEGYQQNLGEIMREIERLSKQQIDKKNTDLEQFDLHEFIRMMFMLKKLSKIQKNFQNIDVIYDFIEGYHLMNPEKTIIIPATEKKNAEKTRTEKKNAEKTRTEKKRPKKSSKIKNAGIRAAAKKMSAKKTTKSKDNDADIITKGTAKKKGSKKSQPIDETGKKKEETNVLQLKVQLKNASPPTWVRFLIPANSTFQDLHEANSIDDWLVRFAFTRISNHGLLHCG